MAEPGPAGPTRDVANEGRLRAARRETPPAEPGPSESDEAAAQAQQMRNPRAASDEAAAQNIERRQGITQRAGVQIDRQRTEYAPQAQVGNLSIARGQQTTEREEIGAGAKDRDVSAAARQQRLENQLNRARRNSTWKTKDAAKAALAGLDAAKAATMPARATPQGAAIGAGVDAAGGGVKAAMMAAKAIKGGGLDSKQIQQTFGRGCVKMLWQNLWLTFGHSIYLLVIIFLATSQSRFARRWFPQVAEEWIPPEVLSKIPKSVLVPLKLAETLALAFVLFWVLLLDLTCLGIFAFFVGLIIAAANAV